MKLAIFNDPSRSDVRYVARAKTKKRLLELANLVAYHTTTTFRNYVNVHEEGPWFDYFNSPLMISSFEEEGLWQGTGRGMHKTLEWERLFPKGGEEHVDQKD